VSFELAVVLLLLAAAVVMFVINRPRMDVVALIMIVALPLTGVITMGEAVAGFSDANVVLIAVLFVIGEGLVRTGVARRLGDWINAKAGDSETRLLVLLMVAVAGLGAVMSSTAVVAIFLPVVLRICQSTGMAPGRLMMPLSFAALISGMLTLVATAPNLVVNAELTRQGETGFHFFSVTPFGVPVLILGILYMLFARRWLGTAAPAAAGRPRPSLRTWIEQYQLAERGLRVRVLPQSPLVGKRLDEVALRASGVNLLAIERRNRSRPRTIPPLAQTELHAGDVLFLDVRVPDLEAEMLRQKYGVEPVPLAAGSRYLTDRAQELGMVEAIVPAESNLIGQSVLEARVRSDYGLTVIGLRRGRSVHGHGLLEEKLRVGDTLLLVGFWKDIERLQSESGSDLVVLATAAELQEVLPAPDKAPQALAILALVVGLMISGVVANVHAVLIGCLLMGLLGCVDMPSAYRSINWQSLILIVGMLPFSLALQRTGGVDLAAEAMLAAVGAASPRLVLAALFVITAGLGLFISNTATAVLMAPVALALASDLGASPYPFAMIVALAASTAFVTPVSSPVNTLVVVPGNYVFGDFVRIGLPFSVIVLIIAVLLVPLLLPLH
jgi:di/tricarboxylate transporter